MQPVDDKKLVNSAIREKALLVLRWIAFLPAAFIGSTVLYYVVVILNRITMARYVDPSSFTGRIFLTWIGPTVSGFALVYIAARVAPTFRKRVACIVAGALLFLTGGVFGPALAERNLWLMFGYISYNVGSIATAYAILNDQIESLREKTS